MELIFVSIIFGLYGVWAFILKPYLIAKEFKNNNCCDGDHIPDEWLGVGDMRCDNCGGYGAIKGNLNKWIKCYKCHEGVDNKIINIK